MPNWYSILTNLLPFLALGAVCDDWRYFPKSLVSVPVLCEQEALHSIIKAIHNLPSSHWWHLDWWFCDEKDIHVMKHVKTTIRRLHVEPSYDQNLDFEIFTLSSEFLYISTRLLHKLHGTTSCLVQTSNLTNYRYNFQTLTTQNSDFAHMAIQHKAEEFSKAIL